MRLSSDRPSRLDPGSIRLSLIALIDVVLFLLFYFVISYSVSAEESQLATGFAKPGQSDSPMEPQVVIVSQVQERTEFRIGSHQFTDRAQLTELLRTLPKEPGVVIKAAPDAPVSATAAAVQAGRDAGFTNVRFAISAAPAVPGAR